MLPLPPPEPPPDKQLGINKVPASRLGCGTVLWLVGPILCVLVLLAVVATLQQKQESGPHGNLITLAILYRIVIPTILLLAVSICGCGAIASLLALATGKSSKREALIGLALSIAAPIPVVIVYLVGMKWMPN